MADRFTKNWDHERHKGWRVGTLWCANWDVDGDVTLAPDFDDMSDTAKIDLLSDFIGLLNRERDTLLKEVPDHICDAMGWPNAEEREPPAPKTVIIGNIGNGTEN